MMQQTVLQFPYDRVKPAKYILSAAVIPMTQPIDHPIAVWCEFMGAVWLTIAMAWRVA